MRYLLYSFIVVTVSVVAGCATPLSNIDYDTGFSFSQFQVYAMAPSEKQSYQSLDDGRIESAITQSLSGRYQVVAKDQADFLVTYRLEEDHKVSQSGFSFGVGVLSSSMGVGVSTGPEAKETVEGKLVLDVVDVKTQQAVWSAKANRNLKIEMKPAQRAALIDQLVADMLGNFPP